MIGIADLVGDKKRAFDACSTTRTKSRCYRQTAKRNYGSRNISTTTGQEKIGTTKKMKIIQRPKSRASPERDGLIVASRHRDEQPSCWNDASSSLGETHFQLS